MNIGELSGKLHDEQRKHSLTAKRGDYVPQHVYVGQDQYDVLRAEMLERGGYGRHCAGCTCTPPFKEFFVNGLKVIADPTLRGEQFRVE